MQKHFTLLLSIVAFAIFQFAAPLSAVAQLDGLGVIIQVKTKSGTTAFTQGSCGYGIPATTATWAGSVTEGICGQGKWGKDSLACAPLSNSLAGNIGLVRRKTCNFSLKAYHAQQAGAKAVIILNHSDNLATEDDCFIIGMTAGDSAAAVTIPAIFASRGMSNYIDDALKAGELIEICFALPTIKNGTAEFSYATPVSQHDRLGLMTIEYTNRSGADQSDVIFKADVIDPTGLVTSFTTAVPVVTATAADTLINFDEYDVPALEGKYKVVYSVNKYTESKDTVVREFVLTPKTFATDNLNITGSIGPSDAQFGTANLRYQTAGMVFTGPDGFIASYASFGLGNAAAIAVGDPAADVVNVILYDNDADENGETDLTDAGFGDLIPVAYVDYNFTAAEPVNVPIYVKLEDLTGGIAVTLKPNHFYMISMLYDGNTAGSGQSLAFTRTSQVPYPQFTGIGLHTPLFLDQMYSGWNGATVVTRLHEEGFEPSSTKEHPRLSDSKFNITPNPANDVVRLNMELAEINPSVAVSLIDFQGRVVSTQVQRNFQNGQISFDAKSLPSGAYSAWIRTSKEGSTMAKLLICH